MAEGGEIDRIGDYALTRILGEGGMGVVYEATERLTGRRVALKVLHRSLAGRADARARFVTEMQILTTLEHPSIVRCLSTSEIDGRLVMVLELLEGRTLREELEQRGALAPARAIRIAHARSPAIVHRDLKPENLMLTPDGNVKVMDFGIAKVLGAPSQTRATQAIGTAQYMSPEQAEGGAITERTDLYALGLVLYEMLAGAPPFQSPSVLGLLRKQCEEEPPPLPDPVRRQIPRELEELVFSLLEKKVERRPSSAAGVAARLGQLGAPGSGTDATVAIAAGATAAMTRLPPMTGLVPARVPPIPAAGRAPKRADTIALLDRFDSRRRRLAFILVASGIVVALALMLGARQLSRSGAESPKSKRSASARTQSPPAPTAVVGAPPAPAPAAASADLCRGRDFCRPSAIATPSRVEADEVIAELNRFAVESDPGAKLAHLRFDKAISSGALDLTRPRGYASATYTIPRGALYVDLREGVLRGFELSPSSEQGVLAPARCSFRQAFEAAAAKGFSFNADSTASLTNASRDKSPHWDFLTNHAHASVNGDTCEARIFP